VVHRTRKTVKIGIPGILSLPLRDSNKIFLQFVSVYNLVAFNLEASD